MGKRKAELQGLLGPLETEVMETVWELGETTVRDVHAASPSGVTSRTRRS
jgi:predicted transcriptional regulator